MSFDLPEPNNGTLANEVFVSTIVQWLEEQLSVL